jgi:hypothetical protein
MIAFHTELQKLVTDAIKLIKNVVCGDIEIKRIMYFRR